MQQRYEKNLHFEQLESRQLLAANILVVWSSTATQVDDSALFAALMAGGHTVDADSGSFTTVPPSAAQLADVDLIVVSRATNSSNYNTNLAEIQSWNTLAKPMLLMNPYLARDNRWGWLDSATLDENETAPANYGAFPNASHPFVAGQTTAFALPGATIDSLDTNLVPSGSTIVASLTVGGDSDAAIVDIPAGASSFVSGGGVFGARRVYANLPDYNDIPNQNFDDVVTANARAILLNIVDELTTNGLEAENATLSGPTVETLNSGFTGTGYADFGTAPGQFIQWAISAPQAGVYNLIIRYANGSGGNRPLQLNVNGALDQSAMAFNATGTWTNWTTVTEPIVLTAGANSVRLTMNGAEGPNIDNIALAFLGPVNNPPDAAPTDLAATVVSSTQINLFWSDNATNETEYQVERRLASGGSFATIATVPANSTSFNNTAGLTANTQYLYRVRAANASGQSAYSNEANATTLPLSSTVPAVTNVTPAPGGTAVFLDKTVIANVHVPNGGINSTTLNATTVRIYPTANPGAPVAAVLNTSGGGDIIVARPVSNLAANTSYTFEVTAGLQDDAGVGFTPFTSTFTTGTQTTPLDTSIQFQHVALANVPTGQYTCVTIGPDSKLYAVEASGFIYRWGILPDGTLGSMETLDSFHTAQGDRLTIGLKFDPSSTAGNLIAWVTHSEYALSGATDFAGRLTRLSGASLQSVQDYIVHLPRSEKDHVTNQIEFGPDGKLYFLQGSMSAMGAPDAAWSFRNEHLLSGAVLRFDPALWNATVNGPLDVHTEDADPYNPFAVGAPLTIFASGVRNAYDLVWHSNGFLYVPTNGSAAGGNTPATPSIPPGGLLPRIDSGVNGPYTGPAVPALTDVGTQHDWLFRVEQGGYYGHPNPKRNEFVLNGGNPSSGADPGQVNEYPVTTQPDRNWRGAAFDFGLNFSPDGVIEYKYGGFGGSLVGRLLVVRFSAGDDIMVLQPGAGGNIVSSNATIASFDGFDDPLDLVENTANGNLYVSQFDRSGGQGKITLLRALEPKLGTSASQLIFDEVRGNAASAAKTVTVSNMGTGNLTLSNTSITGTEASLFSISPALGTPQTIPPGGTLNISVVFNPLATTMLGPHSATLRLVSNDLSNPTVDFYLGGLATAGEEGNFEPSWQWILNTFRIPITVGDSNLNTAPIEGIVLPNANNVPRFVKAGPGAVTIEVLAAFVTDSDALPAGFIGWYDSPAALHELVQLGSGDSGQHQELNPTIQSGVTSFDPGAADFGMYSSSPTFAGRIVYSENALNTWDGGKQKNMVFPLRDISGAVVPNAYLVGTEEATNNDFQDYVYIIRNVAAVTGDFNEDGRVDGFDFLAWQRGLGAGSGAATHAGRRRFQRGS